MYVKCLFLDQGDEDMEIEMVQRELNLSEILDKQIMSAIESDTDENNPKRMDVTSGQKDYAVIMQKCNEMRNKLKETLKMNEELQKKQVDLEVERDLLSGQIADYGSRILEIK